MNTALIPTATNCQRNVRLMCTLASKYSHYTNIENIYYTTSLTDIPCISLHVLMVKTHTSISLQSRRHNYIVDMSVYTA